MKLPARLAPVLPLLCLAGLPAHAQETLQVRDDFSGYPAGSDGSPNWVTTSLDWEVRDGAYRFSAAQHGFAILGEGPVYGRLVAETTIRLTEGVGADWKVAGLSVYMDERHYWHLALVQSPDGNGARHYVELAEMLDGEWLSQNKLESLGGFTPGDHAWEYGVPYAMRIEVDPASIVGTISDATGKQLHRFGYRFSAPGVKLGRPALHVSGFAGLFDDVVAEGSEPTMPPAPPKPPPYDVDSSQRVIGEAKGFFQVREVEGVWWAVDPHGRAFYALGTDHCRYSGHWCEKLGYAPYGRHMEAKYGSAEAWAVPATTRLKDWSFNLIGAGGDRAAYYRGLAHTEFAAFGSGFAGVSDLCPKTTWTGFPNVFHPKWEAFCDRLARSLCAPRKDDPWLFGYFLDNELEWYGKSYSQWGLFDETMKKPADHSGKVALVGFLRDRHRTIQAFNKAWGTKLTSFDDLLKMEALPDGAQEALRKVKTDFVRLAADRYFAVACAAIRKHDPNHMVIGCRFAGDAPAGIWDIAGKHCDIVTFNYYGNVDLEAGEAPGLAQRFSDYYGQARRPLMITEWSFPALDSGLPCKHGAGQRFDTQTQRAQAYDIFQTMVLSLPFMVGSDYFMWVDEPALGISSTFPEDTSYGLVNEQDESYPELTATAKRVNAQAYELHEAGMADLRLEPLRVTATGLRTEVRNLGRRPVAAEVAIITDGRTETRRLELPPGARAITLERDRASGGHLVAVEVDPERKLSDHSRSDNVAAATYYVPGAPWAEGAAKGTIRIPLVVANPGSEPLSNLPVVVPLRRLGRIDWQKTDWSRVYLTTAAGEPLAMQIDPYRAALTEGSELCFLLPEVAGRSAATCFVTILPTPQERREALSPVAFEPRDGGFILRSGPLELVKSKPTGDLIDEIIVDGVTLGRYNPLVWQDPGQNQWVPTDRFEGVQASVGPVRAVLTLTANAEAGRTITQVDEQGSQATQEQTPVPFRVAHQVIVTRSPRPEFRARFVSIENLGDRPLVLKGYFFYLLSAIGGDSADDTTAAPDVPNYWAGGQGAWRDAKVGMVFGAEPWPGSDLRVDFFRDPGGAQHPDARREFEAPVVVQPGQTYTEADAPLLVVYGARAEGTPWRDVQRRLKQEAELLVEVVEGQPKR